MTKSAIPHPRVVTCNAYKSLGVTGAESVIEKVTKDADVVLWQEIETEGHRDAIKALIGWQTFWPGGSGNATPISWRTATFPTVHRAGHAELVLKGHEGAYPDKWVVDIVLADTAGDLWPFITGHPPAQAFTSHRERYKAWRIVAKALRVRSAELAKKYGRCVGGGDMNRGKWKPYVARGMWALHGTFGSAYYDVIWIVGKVKRVGAIRRISTRSDHDALTATLRATA